MLTARRRAPDHSFGASLDALLTELELELRAEGRLSFETCDRLRVDPRIRGLEGCLAFLRCITFAADPGIPAIPRWHRMHACRLLLLSLGAHTTAPRWAGGRVEQMLETAMQVPGAELSDIVQALFALLGELTGTTTKSQAGFVREVAAQVVDRRDRGQSAADFVWIAVRLSDPVLAVTESQAYLAALALPQTMRDRARELILGRVHSPQLLAELMQLLPE